MPLRTRVWSFGKLLILIGALGVTFLVFFGLAMRVALRAREVQVPSLAGKSVADATRMLVDLGLGVRVDESRRTDEKIAEGMIVQQDPPAGAQARSQRTVRVWVSSGPRVTTVPPLAGQTERTAQMRVEQDGLEVQSLTEFRSPDYPAGTVIGQEPPAGSRAKSVSLLVNRGEESAIYVMPDVIGTEGTRVAAFLRSRGFRVTIVGSQPYPGIPPGTVVRQVPPGGFRVAAADSISLEVSR